MKLQSTSSTIQVGTRIIVKYSNVPATTDGWVLDTRFLPADGDLMDLKIEGLSKTFPGWWNGRQWTGLKIKEDYKIIGWKRRME